MKVIIENVTLLKDRLADFISIAKQVLNHRREFLWSSFEMEKGKCRRVSLTTSKKRFKAQFIDRYTNALQCLESNDFNQADWIDLRDVLYHVCYTINMQGEKSMKAFRESKKDIVIEVNGDIDYFVESLSVFKKSNM